MKGPLHRIQYDVSRQWHCHQCGVTVRTRGDVTSHWCDCDKKQPIAMKLVDLPAVRFEIPDPGEEPQSQAELLLTAEDLTAKPGPLPELPRTLTMHDTLTDEIAARVEAEDKSPKSDPEGSEKSGEEPESASTEEQKSEPTAAEGAPNEGAAKKKKRSRRRRNRRKKKKS